MSTIKKYRLWIIYLLIGTIITLALTTDDYLHGQSDNFLKDFFIDLVLILPFISVLGYSVSRLIDWFDRKLSWKDHFLLRILAVLSFITIVSGGTTGLYLLAESQFNIGIAEIEREDLTSVVFALFLIIALIISIVIIFHEFMSSLKAQEELRIKSEVLQRKNIEAEYQMLKNQINPHFLFNNLSVLSALVYKDPEKSDEFIKQFSEIFRYILELNSETVVKLDREIHFLDSYFYLLKMRFGECVEFVKNISEDKLSFLIPPLSTQFLVENAIKHNRIDAGHHLMIEVFEEDNYLVVRNNIKFRNEPVQSTGTGLRNLSDKYRIITDRLPHFGVQNEQYVAKLPLIAPEDA